MPTHDFGVFYFKPSRNKYDICQDIFYEMKNIPVNWQRRITRSLLEWVFEPEASEFVAIVGVELQIKIAIWRHNFNVISSTEFTNQLGRIWIPVIDIQEVVITTEKFDRH